MPEVRERVRAVGAQMHTVSRNHEAAAWHTLAYRQHMNTLGMYALVMFGYVLAMAATGGYFERRGWWDLQNDEWAPAVIGVLLWPLFWTGAIVWRLFMKPTIPIIVGVYRISAGMTFFPPEGEDDD